MTKALKALMIPLWLITLAAVACIKQASEEMPHPSMQYTYLQNLELRENEYYHLDIDGNGTPDFTFHTQLVGDPLLKQDRRQFLAGSKIETDLLNDENDQSPRLNRGDKITVNHKGYNWYELSSLVLAEKVTPEEGAVFWQGRWKDASHNYLPVKLTKGGKVFLGWVEISFNQQEQKLVLHKAAISTESGKEIRAGY